MSIRVSRNSFNAGEISPLMDARVDEAKHPFSCRIMQNFIPKVYGGAFRRPGTIYTGTARYLAEWTEKTEDHRIDSVSVNATAPGVNDDITFYQVGSLWLKDVRSVYKCTSATAGAATWALQDAFTNNLYGSDNPTVNDDTTPAGYAAGSVWFNQNTNAIFLCSSATNGAAAWGQVAYKINWNATATPTTGDDSADGYAVGSFWIVHTRTLYKCTSSAEGAATWATVSELSKLWSDRVPTGADNGDSSYVDGSYWIGPGGRQAWELTSLTNTAAVRLLDLNVSATTRYVLEFGDGYLRIWNDDGTAFIDELNSPYNLPLQLSTPYRSTEIFEVQIAQLGNLAYFAHPNHPPQKLARYFDASFSAATFVWSKVNWGFPAFRDTNTSTTTGTPSATTGLAKTISFTSNVFTETMDYSEYAGARIMLTHRRAASHVKLDLPTPGSASSSSEISVLGEFQFYTYGTFTGTVSIESKDSAGAWKVLRSFEGTSDRQIVFSSATEKATSLRITRTAMSAASGATAYLEAGDSRRVGYASIISGIGFESSLPVVYVDVELDFDATTATTEWAIEAWGTYAGYPRAVCFHEQRLWFGGTELQPNTFWASVTNDFENFRRGAFDADALAFTLAATEGSAIQSMVSHEALVFFTQSEEWTATTSQDTAITPSNIFVRRQSRFGSAHRQAIVAANNLLFVQRGSRKLRQFSYSGGAGAQGQASDLTLLAEHVTRSGIKQIAFQQQPDPILWAVTNAGVLLSLTYEADQGVIAWARHTSGTGTFESVAVIYGDDGEADEVWLSVKRGTRRLIERMDSEAFTKLEEDDVSRMIYLDSAVLVENETASDDVTGLSHLNGEDAGILADGAVQAAREVSAGAIVLDGNADTVVVGLPYESILQPSKAEIQLQNGTGQGRKWLCKQATLNLWKTFGLEYADAPGADKWFAAVERSTETDLGDPEPLFTGFVDVTNLGDYNTSVDLTIRQTLPLPCNVLAMIPKIEVAQN